MPPVPTFWGAVVPKRIIAYQKRRARQERTNLAFLERQRLKKLRLLFGHYGIADKKDMAALAWALAGEHVPGFKVQSAQMNLKRGGRKLKWNPSVLNELYWTVLSIKEEHRLRYDRQALQLMMNNKYYAAIWGVPSGHKGSKQQWMETLEARLQDAKRFQKRQETLLEQAERGLKAAAASLKFRK